MKKRIQMALALLLAVVLLCSALPVPEVYGESEEGEPRQLDKDLSREEDKSKKPQNEWTDVENTEYWNMLFAGVKRTGNWGEDLAHIAFTQIGYKESILNILVLLNVVPRVNNHFKTFVQSYIRICS